MPKAPRDKHENQDNQDKTSFFMERSPRRSGYREPPQRKHPIFCTIAALLLVLLPPLGIILIFSRRVRWMIAVKVTLSALSCAWLAAVVVFMMPVELPLPKIASDWRVQVQSAASGAVDTLSTQVYRKVSVTQTPEITPTSTPEITPAPTDTRPSDTPQPTGTPRPLPIVTFTPGPSPAELPGTETPGQDAAVSADAQRALQDTDAPAVDTRGMMAQSSDEPETNIEATSTPEADIETSTDESASLISLSPMPTIDVTIAPTQSAERTPVAELSTLLKPTTSPEDAVTPSPASVTEPSAESTPADIASPAITITPTPSIAPATTGAPGDIESLDPQPISVWVDDDGARYHVRVSCRNIHGEGVLTPFVKSIGDMSLPCILCNAPPISLADEHPVWADHVHGTYHAVTGCTAASTDMLLISYADALVQMLTPCIECAVNRVADLVKADDTATPALLAPEATPATLGTQEVVSQPTPVKVTPAAPVAPAPPRTTKPDDTAENEAAMDAAQPSGDQTSDTTVYYFSGSRFYHLATDCGSMQGAPAHTLAEAVIAGKPPCPYCNPQEAN